MEEGIANELVNTVQTKGRVNAGDGARERQK